MYIFAYSDFSQMKTNEAKKGGGGEGKKAKAGVKLNLILSCQWSDSAP